MYWVAFPPRITPSKTFPQGFPTRRFCICRFNRWCSLSLQNAVRGRGSMGSLGSACILDLEVIGARAMKQSESRSTVPLLLHSGKPPLHMNECAEEWAGVCIHIHMHTLHIQHTLYTNTIQTDITHMCHTHDTQCTLTQRIPHKHCTHTHITHSLHKHHTDIQHTCATHTLHTMRYTHKAH